MNPHLRLKNPGWNIQLPEPGLLVSINLGYSLLSLVETWSVALHLKQSFPPNKNKCFRCWAAKYKVTPMITLWPLVPLSTPFLKSFLYLTSRNLSFFFFLKKILLSSYYQLGRYKILNLAFNALHKNACWILGFYIPLIISAPHSAISYPNYF